MQLNLFDYEQAREHVANGGTGLWASQQKWESFITILKAVKEEASECCGLCVGPHDCKACLYHKAYGPCAIHTQDFAEALDEPLARAIKLHNQLVALTEEAEKCK